MGEVLTTMKIMPDSPDIDLEGIKSTIESSMPEGAKIHEISEEPKRKGRKTKNTEEVEEPIQAQAPKRRGRPRKNPVVEQEDESILPGFETPNTNYQAQENDDGLLPGFEDINKNGFEFRLSFFKKDLIITIVIYCQDLKMMITIAIYYQVLKKKITIITHYQALTVLKKKMK